MMSVRNQVRASFIRNPSPLLALICSATIMISHAPVSAKRSPTRKFGTAPGTTTSRTSRHRPTPNVLAVSISLASTPRMPA